MVADGKIYAPVTTTDVCNVLGISTHNIGRQIAIAKSGGEDITLSDGSIIRTAFRLRENTPSMYAQGEMLPGALPFWNIWSINSPGNLTKGITSSNVSDLIVRLDNSQHGFNVSDTGYVFNLGGFKDYDHNAIPPSFTVTAQPGYLNTTTIINVEIVLNTLQTHLEKFFGSNWNSQTRGIYVKMEDVSSGLYLIGEIYPNTLEVTDEGILRGSYTFDKHYYEIDHIVDIGPAVYNVNPPTDPSEPITYDLNQALMLGKLLGTTHIKNKVDIATYATFEFDGASPYFKDNNITVSRDSANGYIKISGGYIYPDTLPNGQPNTTVQVGAYLKWRMRNVNTNVVVAEGGDSSIEAPTLFSPMARRFTTITNIDYYTYEQNMKFELYFGT